jgi:hypothetical protein
MVAAVAAGAAIVALRSSASRVEKTSTATDSKRAKSCAKQRASARRADRSPNGPTLSGAVDATACVDTAGAGRTRAMRSPMPM